MAAKKPQGRARTRLYLITPPQIDLQAFAPRLDEALSAGDVASLQLRLKNSDNKPLMKRLLLKRLTTHADSPRAVMWRLF